MSDRASVAIVGSGWWATANHLPALVNRADIQVEAICDINEAKARGCGRFLQRERNLYRPRRHVARNSA